MGGANVRSTGTSRRRLHARVRSLAAGGGCWWQRGVEEQVRIPHDGRCLLDDVIGVRAHAGSGGLSGLALHRLGLLDEHGHLLELGDRTAQKFNDERRFALPGQAGEVVERLVYLRREGDGQTGAIGWHRFGLGGEP